ncbi:MAG: hypothetical protein CVV64_12835 [Candidatus Wallbacteria bacterium HGW-Wallbacteria-1]|jgi:hypothetical protein|uniref:Right handed beta helix domain-containing protein n=1 Tax=Candidatus Wallbacteria bacterium HGW-Wallbacteria-1 TaxID=2013854 RepID=A0A2N1PMX9_9BACT|nr:MAG: hypothetical protein CVV64_12835 [Candidatus Wallbacteria bacterium HGW-Wallbacteria-1]
MHSFFSGFLKTRLFTLTCLLFSLMVISACGGTDATNIPTGPTGALSMKVSIASTTTALSFVKPSTLKIIVGSGSQQKITTAATSDQAGSTIITDIPVGASIPVITEAMDASGIIIYRGSTTANFEAGATTVVNLTLWRVHDMLTFFPINQGDIRQYANRTEKVVGRVIFNGTEAWEFQSTGSDYSSASGTYQTYTNSDYFVIGQDSIKIMGSIHDSSTVLTVLDPPISIPRFLQVGQVFTTSHRALNYSAPSGTTVCPTTTPQTQSPASTITIESRIEVAGLEPLTTSTGLIFAETLKMSFSTGPDGKVGYPSTFNFAQGIGMVREESRDSDSTTTRIDLLKGALINGLQFGSISGTTPPPPTTSTTDIWVDAAASAGGNGSSTSPFNTLGPAIDAVNATTSSAVQIKLVNRSAPLTLDNPRTILSSLSIEGGYAAAGDTAPGSGSSFRTAIDLSGTPFALSAFICNNGVTLKNVSITGPGANLGSPLLEVRGGSMVINNCSFASFIAAVGCNPPAGTILSGHTLSNLEFIGCYEGMSFSSVSQMTISSCIFSNCVNPIILAGSENVSISSTNASASASTSSTTAGLLAGNCSSLTLSEMEFSGFRTGFTFNTVTDLMASNCILSNCSDSSLILQQCMNATVKRIKVLGYNGTALSSLNSSGTFSNVIIDSNDPSYSDYMRTGVLISGNTGVVELRNCMIHRATSGISITSAGPIIRNCIIDTCSTGINETDISASPSNLSYNIFHQASYQDMLAGPIIKNFYVTAEFAGISGTPLLAGNQVYSSSELPPAAITTNPTSGDYTLATGSPAINTGDPSINDRDSSVSDIGPYGGPEAW